MEGIGAAHSHALCHSAAMSSGLAAFASSLPHTPPVSVGLNRIPSHCGLRISQSGLKRRRVATTLTAALAVSSHVSLLLRGDPGPGPAASLVHRFCHAPFLSKPRSLSSSICADRRASLTTVSALSERVGRDNGSLVEPKGAAEPDAFPSKTAALMATVLWRTAHRTLWLQALLLLLASVPFAMAGSIHHSSTLGMPLGSSALLSLASGGLGAGAASLLMGLLHMLWVTGYNRAAVKLYKTATAGEEAQAEPEQKRADKGGAKKLGAQPVTSLIKAMKGSLNVGTGIALLGIVLAVVGAEQVVGAVVYRMLAQRGFVLEFWLANPPLRMNVMDIFVVQACLGALLCHIAGLLATRKLLRVFDP